MKLSISDELEYISFTPRQSVFDSFVKKYGDEQSAMYALEYRVRQYLRTIPVNKRIRVPRKSLKIPVDKVLRNRLNVYCQEMNYSYNDFIEKVMICTRKP